MPSTASQLARLAPLFSSVALLSACIGGGGSDAPAAQPNPPAPVKISGVVAIGPLRGGLACYDVNDNRVCDGDDPRAGAASDSDGNFSIDVAADRAGRHRVVVAVPADAVDRNTGSAISAALTMVTPATGNTAAHAVFVSPLTTAVDTVAQQQNIAVAAAAEQVRTQLGLANSPLSNYVAGNDYQAVRMSAAVGGVAVGVTQLAAAANVPAANTQALINAQTTGNLPALAAQVAAAPASATPAQVAQAVTATVLADANISPTTVAAVAAATAQTAAPLQALPREPFVSLRRFTYTDANNYSLTLFTGDSSKTDANGVFLVNELRTTKQAGIDVPFNRNRAYWTGSAWQVCNREWEVLTTKNQTTTEPQTSTYCGAGQSESRVVVEDIAGQKMADVVTKMRAYPLPDSDGLPTHWGPSPALLGDTVFPAGSTLSSRVSINEKGNTESYGLLEKVAVRWADGSFRHMPGFDADDGNGDRMSGNMLDASVVVSGANAVFLDEYAVPQPADASLRAVARFLVAFGNGDTVRFYKCNVINATGGERDCAAVGDGAMNPNLETKGGKRIARFASGYPAELIAKTNRQRFFIESDGTVFRGATDLQRTAYSISNSIAHQ